MFEVQILETFLKWLHLLLIRTSDNHFILVRKETRHRLVRFGNCFSFNISIYGEISERISWQISVCILSNLCFILLLSLLLITLWSKWLPGYLQQHFASDIYFRKSGKHFGILELFYKKSFCYNSYNFYYYYFKIYQNSGIMNSICRQQTPFESLKVWETKKLVS